MNDIEEIINNKENYIADGMEEFTVDDITYTGYGEYVFTLEKNYVKSPSRASNGSFGNLDTYATFITPRLTVKYGIMPIALYRAMIKQNLNKNEFTVTCYDTIYDKKDSFKMYFPTLSTPTYVTRVENGKVVLIGVKDYTVELVGTNND